MTSGTEHSANLARSLIEGLVARVPDRVRALFAGPADIDDPFAGRQIDGGFEHLVRNWGPASLASIKSVDMEHCTVEPHGRFVGAEFHLELDKDGRNIRLDVVAVLDLDGDKIARSRLYYRRARVDGVQHVRNRILDDVQTLEPYQPILAKYQAALHSADTEGMLATFDEHGSFNGHGEHTDLLEGQGMGIYADRESMRGALSQMFTLVGQAVGNEKGHPINLEKMNGFTDGRNYVLEFNIIDPGHPTNRVHAGVAVYEIGDNGLIKEARIYDEAW